MNEFEAQCRRLSHRNAAGLSFAVVRSVIARGLLAGPSCAVIETTTALNVVVMNSVM